MQGRLGLGAACVGAAKELLELSARFANERKQFDSTIARSIPGLFGLGFLLSSWNLMWITLAKSAAQEVKVGK